jgi:hypothetical protein
MNAPLCMTVTKTDRVDSLLSKCLCTELHNSVLEGNNKSSCYYVEFIRHKEGINFPGRVTLARCIETNTSTGLMLGYVLKLYRGNFLFIY